MKKIIASFQLRLMLIVLVFAVLCPGLFGQSGTDWPCWRGANGDGISMETGWNPKALKQGVKILWTATVGQGHSAVSIKNGLLYTQGSRFLNGDGKEYEEIIYCFNAFTGEPVWQRSYQVEPMAQTGPRATPTVDEGRVYTLGAKGDVFCCDAKTGAVLWKKNLVSENLSGNSKWGYSSSPVVDGKKLILNAGSSGIALDKTTGAVIWKSGLPTWALSTPVFAEIGDTRIALLNTEYTLYAVDVSSGTIRWEYPWPYGDADPVLIQDQIYLFGGKPGRKRCRALIRVTDGSLVKSWDVRRMNVNFTSPIAYKGCLYGITWDKKTHHLYSFDLAAEKLVWNRKLPDWAAFSIADGHIILLHADGNLEIGTASPNSYKVISKAKILQMDIGSEAPEFQPLTCWTAPVLCDGKIYVRNTYGEIACVDVSN